MWVYFDDAETAPKYFELLKKKVSRYVKINVKGAGNEALDLALGKRANLSSKEKSDQHDETDRDEVWAIIDCETNVSHGESEKKRGKKGEVKVALSNPCYEVWTLLHLEDTGTLFANCDAVLKRLHEVWKREFQEDFPRHKAQAAYERIARHRDRAVEWAKKQRNQGQSWTEIYQLVESINSLVEEGKAQEVKPAT